MRVKTDHISYISRENNLHTVFEPVMKEADYDRKIVNRIPKP
jgi:hypothetical protein